LKETRSENDAILSELKAIKKILLLTNATRVEEEILKIAKDEYGLKDLETKQTENVGDIFTDARYRAKEFIKKQPLYYDENGLWWAWDNELCYWKQIKDEIGILNLVYSHYPMINLINSKIITETLAGLKQESRKTQPKDIKDSWIQFDKKIYDIATHESFDSTPEYFNTNPIPWSVGGDDSTPNIDALFNEWVKPNQVKMLYELLAYCCVSDYPIHHIFCLFGSGRNGKSKFQQLLSNFIGGANICSSELDLLVDNRFETAKLYRKLVCVLGETNFGMMKKSSMLKKISGQDLISFEYKNKNPIDDINFAKIVINSNSLPSSLDQSDGFFRRWVIIPFLNEFPEGPCPLKRVPAEEYNNLAKKVLTILPRMLKSGKFEGAGSISDRKNSYIKASNPFCFFLNEECVLGSNLVIKYKDLYEAYCKYLKKNKNRKVQRTEFKTAMEEEGLYIEKTTKTFGSKQISTWWVDGVTLRNMSINYETL